MVLPGTEKMRGRNLERLRRRDRRACYVDVRGRLNRIRIREESPCAELL